VYDVKSSRHVAAQIARYGGRPVMWRSGHSFLKQKMRELGAPLGGELSGHMMFADRWNGFDDAFYAGARLLELLAADPRPSGLVFGELPQGIGTPELMLSLPEGEDRGLMAALLGVAHDLEGVAIHTVDGLRVEADGGWGLVRASHTRPGLMFRFEADDQAALDEIEDLFRRLLARVAPRLPLPF
jgi:phosphomannomutase/phosphoglucomutase